MNFITGDSVPVPVGSASAIPSIDNLYDIGSSTKRWRDGRFVNLYAGATNVGTQLTTIGTDVTDVETKVDGNTASLTKNVNSIYSSVGGGGYHDNWVQSTGGTLGLTQGMATNQTTVVHGTNAGIRYSSDNGVTYSDVGGGITGAGILWVSELNLFVAKSGTLVQTSTNGITWNASVASTGGGVGTGHVYAFGLIVCTSSTVNNYIQTSVDGTTWTLRAATRPVSNIVFTGTKIISFGGSGCMTSTDGITWVNDAQTVNTRACCFSVSTQTIYAIPNSTTSLLKSTDNGVSWTTLTSIFPTSIGPQFIIWDDSVRLGYIFQETGVAATTMFMYQFDGTNRAVGGSLVRQGITTLASAGPYRYAYLSSLGRFIIPQNSSTQPYYSTRSGSIVSTGNITSYGTIAGGGVKVMSYGFNQTTTANAYGVSSGTYGATSGGVSGQSTRFYAPVAGIITAYSKVFLTANATAILNIYVSGVLQYSSVAGDLSTITGSVAGLNVAVAAGAYIEVLLSGATTAGLGTGLIVIVY